MKVKVIRLLIIMMLLAVTGAVMIELIHPKSDLETMKGSKKINIVTTIYPLYLIGLNLVDKTDTIEVTSLINRNTGCLHDYQLTAEDMKVIASANVLVINGGGMEAFLQDITTNYPDLKIIDASSNIAMLQNNSSDKGTNSPSNLLNLSNYNSHVWLDPKLYEKQIENVRVSLIQYIKASKVLNSQEEAKTIKQINENAKEYVDKVQGLNKELEDYKLSLNKNPAEQPQEAVIFHEAFAYLANRIGMKVAFAVEIEADTSLSAGNIARIVESVKDRKIKYLFTEEQYSAAIPRQISEETKARVYVIDSVVTGDGTKNSYLKAMQGNINVLKEAINAK